MSGTRTCSPGLLFAPLDPTLIGFRKAEDAIAIRKQHGMTQAAFWGAVGVEKRTASTYEAGQPIPVIWQLILTVAYGEEDQAQRLVTVLRGEDSWVSAKLLRHPVLRFSSGEEIRSFRRQERLSQDEFWGMVEMKRSRGSRYEIGDRPIPDHVRVLLTLTFGTGGEGRTLFGSLRQRAANAAPGAVVEQSDSRYPPHRSLTRCRVGADVLVYRVSNRITQAAFWQVAGVLQCVGSDYESRQEDLPILLQRILILAFGSREQAHDLVDALRKERTWRSARLLAQPRLRFASGGEVRDVRRARKLEQGEFWRTLELKQARGSRYEGGSRPIPHDVQIMLTVAFGTGSEAATLVEDLRQKAEVALSRTDIGKQNARAVPQRSAGHRNERTLVKC